jgi:hypothetical protein
MGRATSPLQRIDIPSEVPVMRVLRLSLLLPAAVITACAPGTPSVTPPPAATTPISPAGAPTATFAPAPTAIPATPAGPVPQPATTEPPPIYFTVMHANAAFARREFSTALLLYRQAAADDSRDAMQLFVHRVPPGPELRAFARFRIVVADALVGQDDDARATLEQARQQDANTPFPRLGLVFWDTYGMTADPQPACAQVTRLVQADPEPILRSLNNWGHTDLAPGDVCRLP